MEKHAQEIEDHLWMLKVLKGEHLLESSEELFRGVPGLPMLLQKVTLGSRKDRIRAISVLGHLQKIPYASMARLLGKSRETLRTYWNRFSTLGCERLFRYTHQKPRKVEDEKIRAAVFSLLHSPPSEHDINRTSWILRDLERCLAKQGIVVSMATISNIVHSAGYKWRKAKVVLTSNDPEYREKLKRIQMILSNLGENDRFFSIDEFGPFAIKMKAGKRLVARDDFPTVPQFQKSKGCLILTAALELSQNQVTHFYSTKKNTEEMIKLLNLVLKQYTGCRKLYVSWDAASWHASKLLYDKVEESNSSGYRNRCRTAYVELAPLPASAQFLNVIESVFSGMARAIIHNSDYGSIDQAMAAIDRYFAERNAHFQMHAKRAGKKIWGDELVPCEFNEAQNCKDPKWR
jgi:transposase